MPAVEFIAYSLENWDEMLYRKMGDAGVSLVYPENLSISDKEVRLLSFNRTYVTPISLMKIAKIISRLYGQYTYSV